MKRIGFWVCLALSFFLALTGCDIGYRNLQPLKEPQLADDVIATAHENYWKQRKGENGVLHYAQFLHANGFLIEAQKAYALVSEKNRIKAVYLTALIELDSGDSAAARMHLEEVLDAIPDYGVARFRLALLDAKSGNLDEAQDGFKKLERMRALRPYALMERARVLMRSGDEAHAKEVLYRALEADNTHASLFFLLATLYEKSGDRVRADRFQYEGSLRGRYREPEDRWLDEVNDHCVDLYRLQTLADIHYQTGEVEKALAIYKRALELAPNDYGNLKDMAYLYLESGEIEAATPHIQKVLQHPRASAEPYGAYVSSLYDASKMQEALRVALEGLKRFPGDADLLRLAGLIVERSGDLERAEKLYQKAISTDSGNIQNFEVLGKFYLSQGRIVEMKQIFNECFDKFPSAREPRKILAHYYLAQEDLQSAKPLVESLLNLSPAAMGFEEIAISYLVQSGNRSLQSGSILEAEADFRRVLEIDPLHEGALNNLILLYYSNAQKQKAIDFLKTHVATYPGFFAVYDLLARLLNEENDRDQAVEVLNRGIRQAKIEENYESLRQLDELRAKMR